MSKIFGYCRISRKQQSIERQIRNIKTDYPTALIYQEAYTGTKMTRPEWLKLCARVQPGDVIVFDSVSRMARNAEEGYENYKALYELGVELVFLKEPHISTSVYKATAESSVPMTGTDVDVILKSINAYLMILAEKQIRCAFEQAEKEVTDLHQRTAEGIETARRAGKQIGAVTGKPLTTKKSIAAKETIRKHSRDFGGSLNDADCIKLAGCSRNSYYKYKAELKITVEVEAAQKAMVDAIPTAIQITFDD